MTTAEMLKAYHEHSAADAYYVGIIRHQSVYYVETDFDELTTLLRVSRTSSKRGGCAQLRVYVGAQRSESYIASGRAKYLCEATRLTEAVKNRGDGFEKLLKETLTGEAWSKSSLPFWMGGDIEVNGLHIQVKRDSAELTNEGTLERMLETLVA